MPAKPTNQYKNPFFEDPLAIPDNTLEDEEYQRSGLKDKSKKKAQEMQQNDPQAFAAALAATRAAQASANSRSRPTNNQLLYKATFKWKHYPYQLRDGAGAALPLETESCASVTAAFLQVLQVLHAAETSRVANPRNILQTLSTNTRRTKVVELSSGTHRVPDELRKHYLSDGEGGQYSTNLDRNRYGNDDNYLFTVIRYDLEYLGLCTCLVDVEIIDAKANNSSIIVSSGDEACICHDIRMQQTRLPTMDHAYAPAHALGLGLPLPPLPGFRPRADLMSDRASTPRLEDSPRGGSGGSHLFDALVMAAAGAPMDEGEGLGLGSADTHMEGGDAGSGEDGPAPKTAAQKELEELTVEKMEMLKSMQADKKDVSALLVGLQYMLRDVDPGKSFDHDKFLKFEDVDEALKIVERLKRIAALTANRGNFSGGGRDSPANGGVVYRMKVLEGHVAALMQQLRQERTARRTLEDKYNSEMMSLRHQVSIAFHTARQSAAAAAAAAASITTPINTTNDHHPPPSMNGLPTTAGPSMPVLPGIGSIASGVVGGSQLACDANAFAMFMSGASSGPNVPLSLPMMNPVTQMPSFPASYIGQQLPGTSSGQEGTGTDSGGEGTAASKRSLPTSPSKEAAFRLLPFAANFPAFSAPQDERPAKRRAADEGQVGCI